MVRRPRSPLPTIAFRRPLCERPAEGAAGEVNEMRSQQRTGLGFDSGADPRLDIRRAAAAAQRSPEVDDVADDGDQTTADADRFNGSRELEAVGAGRTGPLLTVDRR
jgi:hypothetical protein